MIKRFEEFGKINACYIVKDKNTGKSRGCAFIYFSEKKDALEALKYSYKHIIGEKSNGISFIL